MQIARERVSRSEAGTEASAIETTNYFCGDSSPAQHYRPTFSFSFRRGARSGRHRTASYLEQQGQGPRSRIYGRSPRHFPAARPPTSSSAGLSGPPP